MPKKGKKGETVKTMICLNRETYEALKKEKKEEYFDKVGAASIIVETALREHFAKGKARR